MESAKNGRFTVLTVIIKRDTCKVIDRFVSITKKGMIFE